MKFKVPDGWDNVKCESNVYPNFNDEPSCTCLGDANLNANEQLDLLEKVCREDGLPGQTAISAEKAVPIQARCGIKDKSNVIKDNVCFCTERKDIAASKSIRPKHLN